MTMKNDGAALTLLHLQQRHDRLHGRHGQVLEAARGHGLLQLEAKVAGGGRVVLHGDHLAQRGEGRLHVGGQVGEGGAGDGALEEVAGKGRLRGEGEVGLHGAVRVVAVVGGRRGRGAGGRGGGGRGRGVARAAAGVDGDARGGNGAQGVLDAGEALLDEVDLALTAAVSGQKPEELRPDERGGLTIGAR